jgi:hypothetical protein
MSQSTRKTVSVQAINKAGQTSEPIKMYLVNGATELPKGKFVVRIDSKVTSQGSNISEVSNWDVNLVAGHSPEWLEEKVKGFRRDVNGVTCMIVQETPSNIPNIKALTKAEEF